MGIREEWKADGILENTYSIKDSKTAACFTSTVEICIRSSLSVFEKDVWFMVKEIFLVLFSF